MVRTLKRKGQSLSFTKHCQITKDEEINSTNNHPERGSNMNMKWDDDSWQEEFLKMKAHKPGVARLLMEGPRGLRDAWQLGSLHEEYKRLKKRYKQLQKEQEEKEKTE